jgi:hypothetical protein
MLGTLIKGGELFRKMNEGGKNRYLEVLKNMRKWLQVLWSKKRTQSLQVVH